MPNKVYDILKWVALIAIPALATAYSVIGAIWGLPSVQEVVATITAVGVLIGALIGASAASARRRVIVLGAKTRAQIREAREKAEEADNG